MTPEEQIGAVLASPAAYWLGVATPIALIGLLVIVTESLRWWRWWWRPEQPFKGGKGHVHDADYRHHETGTWYPNGRHTHWWPPSTPWWVIHACEPLRVRLCYLQGDHRPPSGGGA